MNNTTGYVNFYIKSENKSHNLSFFDNYLTIKPTNFSQIGEEENLPIFTPREFSSGELTSHIYHLEISKFIKKLKPHKNELLRLKKENKDVQMVLQVVLYLSDGSPQLYFSKEKE